jgi:hypothetical protein
MPTSALRSEGIVWQPPLLHRGDDDRDRRDTEGGSFLIAFVRIARDVP